MLSKKAKYGLQAVIFLAKQEKKKKGPFMIAELARQENLPKKFLEIILLELKKAGILHSKQGPKGGYSLGRSPSKIFLGQIIRVLDGPIAPISCVSKTAYRKCEECKNEKLCEIRKVMQKVRDATSHILDRTSVEDAVNGKVSI